MQIKKIHAPVLAAVAVAAMTFAHAETSVADVNHLSPQQIASKVLNASDQKAAYMSLTPAQKAQFAKDFSNQQGTVTKIKTERLSAAESAKYLNSSKYINSNNLVSGAQPAAASGCWYDLWQESWSDLGIHDGDSTFQLNWCGRNGRVYNVRSSNVTCQGHRGASCDVKDSSSLNVGWETRNVQNFQATFLWGIHNNFCMEIRGGSTGLHSHISSAKNACSLS